MSSSEHIDVILKLQDGDDKLFAQTTYLKDEIEAVRCAKELAGRGNLEYDDVSKLANCVVASRYVPYISVLGQYVQSNIKGSNSFGSTINVELKSAGSDFTGDTVVYVEFNPFGDENGTTYYRWCDFPGVRLFREVSLQINGQTKDKYTYQNVIEIYDHELSSNQRLGFERAVGQQQAKDARFYNEDSQVTYAQKIYDGPQNYKKYQPKLIMGIPLWFFFCRNPATPLNNDYVSDKNRTIQISIAELKDLVHALDAANNPVSIPAGTVSIRRIYAFSKATWMSPEFKDLFNHPGKLMIRSWGFTEITTTTGTGNIDLAAVKFPVDRLYIRAIPSINTDTNNATNRNFAFDHWHNPQVLTLRSTVVPHFVIGVGPPTLVARNAIFFDEQDAINDINIVLSQTTYFGATTNGTILANHVPLMSEKDKVGRNKGTFMLRFDMDSKSVMDTTASGYIDFTTLSTKELRYTSELISPTNPVKLQISWRYLNMIWPKGDGSIDFRYVTSQSA
jgi:hypothetical protein